jgi:hypothetical protein
LACPSRRSFRGHRLADLIHGHSPRQLVEPVLHDGESPPRQVGHAGITNRRPSALTSKVGPTSTRRRRQGRDSETAFAPVHFQSRREGDGPAIMAPSKSR